VGQEVEDLGDQLTKEKKNYKKLWNNWRTLTDSYGNRNKVIKSLKVKKNPKNPKIL